MTIESTITKLNEMRLSAIAETYYKQMNDPQYRELSFEDRFNLLIDSEYIRRKNSKLERLIRTANLRMPDACIEDIHYFEDRKLDRTTILRLASCNYIGEKQNVILKGASGNGKSYLACALGVSACRNGYTAKYMRLPELLDELALARLNGTYQKTMKAYRKVNLLILDEWLLVSLTEHEARDVLEIVESRYQNASTIFCSQFEPSGWYEQIGEATLADAILDRVIHSSHSLFIDGKISMRERLGIQS
ncbi:MULTISPECIES: IS21-like element helper ATPase IstB [unclassified Planococcus (in: firmicutes)]|uniref:IS21-like element helper ATPase IstB n=1 Tax=unclassified Planococcus (in: firmicutes) TaxID=2662419 RepID=UPI000C338B10|nr:MULTISPECIES: IS21-like element helper ATPase IstB [unclassified Planococcus (in: firmicutes)]AUD15078.1 AAA family ATPase [Planococcus sp. MB-3u-03]PKG46208.1 AAA family ATPase [Planococcus sp. Urea-trap-24]PKG89994.1 AAA family ATPase [Planococcus sp. Urea-3u-39]PKH35706.1 AAA family ATPase [Planococcus sp. MB-3u-09]